MAGGNYSKNPGSSSSWDVYNDVFAPQLSHRRFKAWERAPVTAHVPRLQGHKIWKKVGIRSQQDKGGHEEAQAELEKDGIGARKKPRMIGARENIRNAPWQDELPAKPSTVTEVGSRDIHESEKDEDKNSLARESSEVVQFIPRKRTNTNLVITPRKPSLQLTLRGEARTEPLPRYPLIPAESPIRSRKSPRRSIRRSKYGEILGQAAAGQIDEQPGAPKVKRYTVSPLCVAEVILGQPCGPLSIEESLRTEEKPLVDGSEKPSVHTRRNIQPATEGPQQFVKSSKEPQQTLLPTSSQRSQLEIAEGAADPVGSLETSAQEKTRRRKTIRRGARQSTRATRRKSVLRSDRNTPSNQPSDTALVELSNQTAMILQSDEAEIIMGNNTALTAICKATEITSMSSPEVSNIIEESKVAIMETVEDRACRIRSGHFSLIENSQEPESTIGAIVEDLGTIVSPQLLGESSCLEQKLLDSSGKSLFRSAPEVQNLDILRCQMKDIASIFKSLGALLPNAFSELEEDMRDDSQRFVSSSAELRSRPGTEPTQFESTSDNPRIEFTDVDEQILGSVLHLDTLANDNGTEHIEHCSAMSSAAPLVIEPVESISQNTPPEIYDHDDTDMLRKFLTRVRANKAARARKDTPKETRLVPHSPLRLPLGKVCSNLSPSPPKLKSEFDLNLQSDSPGKHLQRNELVLDEDEVNGSKSIRRSGRTRLPIKASVGTPSFIPVRRLGQDGETTITLRRSEEKELAALTRVNTRKNKAGALSPAEVLVKKSEEQGGTGPRQRFLKDIFDAKMSSGKKIKKGKNVAWAEELAHFQTMGDKEAQVEEDYEKEKGEVMAGADKKSAVRVAISSKIALGMAVNGTPAPKRRMRGRP